jgi:uncharacterized protein DUF397
VTPELSNTVWRKSSYSVGNGQCVELAHHWRKSSYSAGNGECVEVSNLGAVRDSKNPSGPVLVFDQAALAAFVTKIKNG